MKGSGLLKVLLVVVVLGLGGAVVARAVGFKPGLFGDGAEEGLDGALVRRGPLRISVLERANLMAANSVNLKCELEGRSTILWLIEQGSVVEPGDLVCELDTSSQIERRVEQEISAQSAEATHIGTQQVLKIQESQNQSDIKRSEQTLEFARQDKSKYLEGEFPQLKESADEAIELAKEDATRRKNEYEWSVRLAEQGFLEQTQLDADRFSYNSAEIALAQAGRKKELLVKYDHPRRLLELDAAIEEAGRELDRVRLRASALVANYEADVRSSEAKLQLEVDELKKLTDQIEKARMVAPVAGMVVYAKEDRGRYGGGDPIQEGTEVRERQDIITIPSSEGMVAEMKLHESVLERVKEGMACQITVDALPGRHYGGRIQFKSTLPDENAWYANPDLRVYRTIVTITDLDLDLKSGMSCSVEVIVDDLDDVLHIPLQAVFLNRGLTACFVSDGGMITLRDVKVGQDDGKWVEVASGLVEGEVVLMAQPPGLTLEPAPEEGREGGWGTGEPVHGREAGSTATERGPGQGAGEPEAASKTGDKPRTQESHGRPQSGAPSRGRG